MAVTQYVGARYVPLFSEPLDWDITKEYEPLTIVYYAGNSYTSRQAVPKNIEITNEDYWALTGNYNAQIEQYRKEVQAYDAKIKENTTLVNNEKARALAAEKVNSDAIATEKARALAAEKVNSDAIATEKARALAAEKVNSDAIATEKARALAAEAKITDSLMKQHEVFHFGAVDIVANYPQFTNPQGFCIAGDSLICMLTDDSESSNATKTVTINKKTGSVVSAVSTNFGHANGVGYDHETNKLYVCPCYDYSNNKAQTNYMYQVNPSSMAIEKTISFDFEPHSICFDRITGECYITEERLSPFGIYLRKVTDKTSWKTEVIGKIDTNLTDADFVNHNESYGTQAVGAYDGNIWYLVGGNEVNALLKLSKEDASTIEIISNIGKSYVYPLKEAEGFDFDENGDIFLCSTTDMTYGYPMAVVSMMNMYGGKCVRSANSQENGTFNIHVNPTNSANISKTGSSSAPFSNFYEGLLALKEGNGKRIIIDKATETQKTDIVCPFPIVIEIPSGSSLSLNTGIKGTTVSIIGKGDTSLLKFPTSGKYHQGCFYIEAVTVSGEQFHIEGLLSTTNVTGGSFDGSNHTGLFKSPKSTGTYTRFLAATTS